MRITKTHIRAAFDNLRDAAVITGVPGAQHWALTAGNKNCGVAWRIVSMEQTRGFSSYDQNLTTDMRIAYERIVGMTHLLQYVRSQMALPLRPGPVASGGKERGDATR